MKIPSQLPVSLCQYFVFEGPAASSLEKAYTHSVYPGREGYLRSHILMHMGSAIYESLQDLFSNRVSSQAGLNNAQASSSVQTWKSRLVDTVFSLSRRIAAIFSLVIITPCVVIYPSMIRDIISIPDETVAEWIKKHSGKAYTSQLRDECDAILSDFYLDDTKKIDVEKVLEQVEKDMARNTYTKLSYQNVEFPIDHEKDDNSSIFMNVLREHIQNDEWVYESMCYLQQGARAGTFRESRRLFENSILSTHVGMLPVETRSMFPTQIHVTAENGLLQVAVLLELDDSNILLRFQLILKKTRETMNLLSPCLK